MPNYIPTPIEQEIITLLKKEITNYTDGTTFITDKVAFQCRNIVRKARKNYFGIFDEPKDPNTGIDKIWVPLGEIVANTILKSIDIDTKDVQLRANKPEVLPITNILRNLLRQFLTLIGYGEELDFLEREVLKDGTAVIKVFKGYSEMQKKNFLRSYTIDLLNIFIDPQAKSLHEEPIIERALIKKSEFDRYDKWVNKDLAIVSKDKSKTYDITISATTSEEPEVEIFERWGKMPKYFYTGDKKDTQWVEGVLIVSNVMAGQPVVHHISLNNDIKPYEELWYERVNNRWYGRGPIEKLFGIQEYLNEVVNIRRNNNRLLQSQIFLIRSGSGITPQAVARLAAGGALVVKDIERDVKHFPMLDQKTSSYKDEETAWSWAERLTSTFDVARGETLPATQTATAANIQRSSVQGMFSFIQEGLGMFIQRWVQRHILPIMVDVISEGTYPITGTPDELKDFDESIVDYFITQTMQQFKYSFGSYPNIDQILSEKERLLGRLKKQKDRRFVGISKDVLKEAIKNLDVRVYVSNEEFDKFSMVQNLNLLLQNYAPYMQNIDPEMIVKEILDILNLGSERFERRGGTIPAQTMPQRPQLQPNLLSQQQA